MCKLINHSRGFSVLELIVTVLIISILVSLSVANYKEYRARAYDLQSMTVARNLETTVLGLIAEGYFLLIGTSDPVNFGHGNGSTGWGSSCTTSYGFPNPLIEYHPEMCTTEYSWMVTFNHIHDPLPFSVMPEGYDIRISRRKEYTPRQYIIAASPTIGRYIYHVNYRTNQVKYYWTK